MKLIKRLENRFTTENSKWKQSFGLFLCPYCKREVEKRLESGKICKSCGCKKGFFVSNSRTKHGESRTRIYNIWRAMISRCNNEKNNRYKNYGYRGISVCSAWENDFLVFKKWALDNGYKDNLQIDREDNDGNYKPENCRWVTNAFNNQNKGNNVLTWEKVIQIRKEYFVEKLSQREIAEQYNINKKLVYGIVSNRHWKIEGVPYGL